MIRVIVEMRKGFKDIKKCVGEKFILPFDDIFYANDRKRIRIQYHNCIGSEVAGGCVDCEVNTRVT